MSATGVRLRVATLLAVALLVAVGGVIGVYAAVPLGVSPVGTLTMPAVQPRGIAVDGSGKVYVTDYDGGVGGQAFVFERDATTPSSTLTGLQSPWDAAVQPATGELYVSNYWKDTVSVFLPGDTFPSRTLIGVRTPVGLALDPAGNLLVSSTVQQGVAVFAAGAVTPSRFIPTDTSPGGIAVDPASGLLYVTSPESGEVAVYDPSDGHSVPELWITGLGEPWDIDLQLPTGVMFVAEAQAGRVSAFQRGATTVDESRTLTGVVGPMGVAVSPRDGRVYVSDARDTVLVYPGVTSSVTEVAPSHGPVTGGTNVRIDGENLGAATSVTFNGVAATLTGPVQPGSVWVRTPNIGSAGPVAVAVTWGAITAGKDAAFTAEPVPPESATSVTAAVGDGRATVTWSGPAFTGGVPITGYLVTATPGGASCSTTATSCTITGLANGSPFTFIVTTTNAASLTSASAPSAPVTVGTPAAFTAMTPPLTATADRSYEYTFAATGAPAPRFSLLGAPAWLSVDPDAGSVSGVPPAGAGSFQYRVVATNGIPPAATTPEFTVVIAQPQTAAPNVIIPGVTVKVRAVSGRSKLKVDIDPNKGKGYWTFQVQRRQQAGTWSALKTYRTRGTKETRTINLGRGTYRVVVNAKYGYMGRVSDEVVLKR